MEIICIKNCEDSYLNKIHYFKQGELYSYNYSVHRNKNFIFTPKNTAGYVTYEFICENVLKYSKLL